MPSVLPPPHQLYPYRVPCLCANHRRHPQDVIWNESGTLVALVLEDSFYVLRYNPDAVATAMAAGDVPEDGIEDAFELEHEIAERADTGQWCVVCCGRSGGVPQDACVPRLRWWWLHTHIGLI